MNQRAIVVVSRVFQGLMILGFLFYAWDLLVTVSTDVPVVLRFLSWLGIAPQGSAEGLEKLKQFFFQPILPSVFLTDRFLQTALMLVHFTISFFIFGKTRRALLEFGKSHPSWPLLAAQTHRLALLFIFDFLVSFAGWLVGVYWHRPTAVFFQSQVGQVAQLSRTWWMTFCELLIPTWQQGTTALLFGLLTFHFSKLLRQHAART